jgi:hypothetical protein
MDWSSGKYKLILPGGVGWTAEGDGTTYYLELSA